MTRALDFSGRDHLLQRAKGGGAVLEPLPSGLARLDAILPGGFLRGQIAELSGAPSSGKRAIALSLCSNAMRDGLGAAWIDSHGGFSPLPALEAGLPVSQLLVIRVAGAKPACKAASLVLRSPGAVSVLVLDIEGPFSLPDPSLARLRHLAAEGGCAVLFVTERDSDGPALSTFVSLRLAVRRARRRVALESAEPFRGSDPSLGLVPRQPSTVFPISPSNAGSGKCDHSSPIVALNVTRQAEEIRRGTSPRATGKGTDQSLSVELEGRLAITILKNKFGPVRSMAEVNADEPDRLRVDSSL